MQLVAVKLNILCEQTIVIFDESKPRILQIIYAKHVKDQKKKILIQIKKMKNEKQEKSSYYIGIKVFSKNVGQIHIQASK